MANDTVFFLAPPLLSRTPEGNHDESSHTRGPEGMEPRGASSGPLLLLSRLVSAFRLEWLAMMTKQVLLPTMSLALVLAMGARGTGGAEPPSEYEVKAAFLFRFSQFVEWPEETSAFSDGAFTIGIVGKDPFGEALKVMAGNRTGGGRALTIRHFLPLGEVEPCHIVFVTREAAAELPRILKSLEGAPVLLVGETEAFAESGGAIELFLEERRVRFEINVKAAERSGVRIHSRVLSLARLVNSEEGKEGN